MVGRRPGRRQSSFVSGELDPVLHERDELKYFSTGVARAENVEIAPQGGFRQRAGLRDIGGVEPDAARLFGFSASDGSVYDLAAAPGGAEAFGETALLDSFELPGVTAPMLPALTTAQAFDTMLVFHPDLPPVRVIHKGPEDWETDAPPFAGIPNHDYGEDIEGEPYDNAVPAIWELQFVGFNSDTAFTLTVANQTTVSMEFGNNMGQLAEAIETQVLALPNVAAGVTATNLSGNRVQITFTGEGNEGDGWAVSGLAINKADAAVAARKVQIGEMPGEPLISADRGWPRCGLFHGQRLLMGGFRSLPNGWMFSVLGDPFNFDQRFTGPDGPALVPMDIPGGEAVERLVEGRNLLIFTSAAEYWLAERGLSAEAAPNHVKSSDLGCARGVPIVLNEGAALFAHGGGGVIAEFRYTDVEGNFLSSDLSLLASHLVDGVRDMALQRAARSADGGRLSLVLDGGAARTATLLREQEVTAFVRVTSPEAEFVAVSVNGRNETSWLVQRPHGRRLERFEAGLLLDEAVEAEVGQGGTGIEDLERFEGRDVWVIGGGHVFGPFTVVDGAVSLPLPVETATVGTWAPPVVTTLPLPRTVGPHVVMKRKARIHSVMLDLIDTTSVAVAANGGPLRDIDLRRFGSVADLPELSEGFTGTVTLRGLTGYAIQPQVTVSQVRPGRLNVRSITTEAQI